jgi:sugar-phosphatase
VLITADDISAGKPSPDGYLLAASRLAVPPHDCVVVEDAPVGVQAALAAGIRVVAVLSTHQTADLRDADAIVPHLSNIRLHLTQNRILLDLIV